MPIATPNYCLSTINPNLAKEWHPDKNGNLTPRDVTPNYYKKVWWLCSKHHEYIASIGHRSRGTGCPYCAGNAVCSDNCLETVNPSLAFEWHPDKNGNLTPHDVTAGSGRKVWWQCSRGHEWEAIVASRNKGRGCPYCAGKAACGDNCLQTVNPSLARDWHPTKNGNLTPLDITLGSHKKVWWQCSKGHEWEAIIYSRGEGIGCPYCAGRLATKENCLQVLNPSLAKEWHSGNNGNLTPADVTLMSNKKVWWQCSKGHEWETTVANRNQGKGCPYCAGQAVCEDNCLQTMNPSLVKEWHATKNDNLTPLDVTLSSGRKVWWQCSRGHEWEATVASRSTGTGCPYCHFKTSELELAIYCEMKYLFGDVQHRARVNGYECDIYVPNYKFAIELDSLYWHKTKLSHDIRKNLNLRDKGILLINARERGLHRLAATDIFFTLKESYFAIICRILNKLLQQTTLNDLKKQYVRQYISEGKIKNNLEFKQLWSILPSPIPELSLDKQKPYLTKEWHPTKNGNLTPFDITVGSGKKVWWQCSKGHEWEAIVANRSKGTGCPYCYGRVASFDNCLQTVNPSLAKEWHPTKNGELSSQTVKPFSNKKVWWQCSKGHEWEARIEDRSKGTGCPYCYRRKVLS